FFDHWMDVIPTPLGPPERERGYWWELSMRQVEVSRTLVFDPPRPARPSVRGLFIDNLALGPPAKAKLISARKVRKTTNGPFSPKLVNRGTGMTSNVFHADSRIKEYLKEGRALRIEFACNSPDDLGCRRKLEHLPELQAKARAANSRLLTIQRAGQGCAISTTLFERVQLPSVEKGQRTG